MPIYEYECPSCSIKSTFVRGINDKDPGYKSNTSNLDLNRLYSLGADTFNGSGFYSKDK